MNIHILCRRWGGRGEILLDELSPPCTPSTLWAFWSTQGLWCKIRSKWTLLEFKWHHTKGLVSPSHSLSFLLMTRLLLAFPLICNGDERHQEQSQYETALGFLYMSSSRTLSSEMKAGLLVVDVSLHSEAQTVTADHSHPANMDP